MECDEVDQCSTSSVHITSEELVKIEPVSFLGTEAFSNPTPTKSTASIPARKKRKNVAKEMLKIAEQQQKRQEKRAKNSNRHNENTAQLPDYRELPQCHNQELSDTNLNDNAVESSDEIQRNVTEISNTEAADDPKHSRCPNSKFAHFGF
ncbi:hypothetical protein Ddc_23549 [Ditylenchus destructor]|nr:hypothetical protein Ddc_23549 [Ditylenchus destructor]